MSEPDYAPLTFPGFVAVWRPIPYVSAFLGGPIHVQGKWVITTTEGLFVATADGPAEVQKLVRFAQKLPKAA